MLTPLAPRRPGKLFYANPGPTNIPDSVLAAMHRNSVDFVEADFLAVFDEARAGLQRLLFTSAEIFFYTASGHGAWEGTMVNLFSPGDKILIIGGGFFSLTWAALSQKFGLDVELMEVDWREGVALEVLQARLKADTGQKIRAVCAVHNETSTSVVLELPAIRAILDAERHPALFLADTISSLGCFEFKMDEWGIDVVVGGSQKGLMLPVGLGFSAAGPKALAAHKTATLPKFYFDWTAMMQRRTRAFTGSIPVLPFYGMVEALRLIEQEGLSAVWARHRRLADAVRAAVRHWGSGNAGPELFCTHPGRYSDSVTTILMPEGYSSDRFRKILLETYNVSTGGGLDKLAGKVFRIGHMGDLNEAMVLGTLGAAELALRDAGVPYQPGGLAAAMEVLSA